MNGKLILHLVLTETKKNAFFVGLLWLMVLIVPEDSSDIFLYAGLALLARLALGEHLIRSNAMWKRMPITFRDWLVSRITLIGLWFVVPYLIQQGWVAHHTLLGPADTAMALAQTGTFTGLLCLGTFTLLSLAERWGSLIAVIGIGVLIIIGVEMTSECFDAPRSTLHHSTQEWNEELKSPYPLFWWLFSGCVIVLSLAFLFWYQKTRSLKMAVPFAAGGLIIAQSALTWTSSNDFRTPPRSAPDKVHLTQNVDSLNSQIIFQDLKIAGLEPDTFVQPHRIVVDGSDRDIYYMRPADGAPGVHKFYKDESLTRYLSGEESLFFAANKSYTYSRPAPINPTKSIEEANPEKTISRIAIEGSIAQWVLIADIPLSTGTFRSPSGISGRLTQGKSGNHTEMSKFQLSLYQPRFQFSSDPQRSFWTNGWGGIKQAIFVVENKSLKERIVLSPYLTSHDTIDAPCIRIDDRNYDLKIPENDAWKILWPKGDATEQWLAGARLQIYTTNYLGRFEDEIYLSTE